MKIETTKKLTQSEEDSTWFCSQPFLSQPTAFLTIACQKNMFLPYSSLEIRGVFGSYFQTIIFRPTSFHAGNNNYINPTINQIMRVVVVGGVEQAEELDYSSGLISVSSHICLSLSLS